MTLKFDLLALGFILMTAVFTAALILLWRFFIRENAREEEALVSPSPPDPETTG